MRRLKASMHITQICISSCISFHYFIMYLYNFTVNIVTLQQFFSSF